MRLRFALPFFVVLLCFSSISHAQSGNTITGSVSDAAGARVPRAPVRLLDAGGRVLAESVSDARGAFRLESAGPAEVILEVELPGFARWRRAVRSGENVEVKLEVAPVRESVVVTATRTEVPTSQLGAAVTAISREEIENRRDIRVLDALRAVLGLAVVQAGPPGAIASVFARGGTSAHNRVFVDGIPVNEPGGSFSFANFAVLNLERIEVVRGPQSALFGSDALGSVIQVFTRRGQAEDRRPHFGFLAEGGNHSTTHSDLSVSGQTGRFDYAAAASRFLTGNQGVNDSFRNTAFSGNLGIAFSERTTLRSILQGDLGTAGTPGQTVFQRPDSDARIHRGDVAASLGLETEWRENWRQRFGYGYSRTRFRSLDLFADPPPFSDFLFDSTNDTRRHRLCYQSDWTLRPAQVFTMAFEYEREKGRLLSIDPAFPAFSAPPVIEQRTNVGGVLQHQAFFFQRLSVTAGVRIESSTSFGKEATPRVSLAYFLRRGASDSVLGATKLKFNFGTGIKEPTFLENFSLSLGFVGNPNLKPERVRSFDFGLEQRFAGDRAKLEVNWFDNRFRDLIAFFGGTFINIGRAKAKGAEVILEASPVRHLRGVGSYTFLDSQVTESQSPANTIIGVGRPLIRRPRHSGSLALAWDWRWFNVTSTTLLVGRRADSDFFFPPLNLTSNPGYARWDLAANYRSPHCVTYFVAFENLTGKRYQEVLGYPALGRSARAGLRWDY